MAKSLSEVFKGFSKLTLDQRLQALKDTSVLSSEDAKYLKDGGMKDFLLG